MSMKHGILMPPYINTSIYRHTYQYINTATFKYINIRIQYINISVRQHTNISYINKYINLSMKHRIPVLPDIEISIYQHIGILTYQYSNPSIYPHMYTTHESIQQHGNRSIYHQSIGSPAYIKI